MFISGKSIYSKVFICLILGLLVFSTSCRKEERSPQDYKGTAWTETNDANFSLVGMHQDGSMVGIKIGDNGNVKEAVFINDQNSPGFYVWIGNDGLPYRAYVDEYLILFDNFTDNTVDIAIIAPSGDTEILREVHVDFPVSPTDLSYHNLNGSSQVSDIALLDDIKWSQVLNVAGHALSIGGCAVSIVAAGGSLGALTPLAALGCTSAMIDLMIDVTDIDNEAIKMSSDAFGTTISAAGCTSLGGCIAFVLGEVLGVGQQAAENYERNKETAQLLEGALEHGYGDVQITLTWNNTSDLDLWVTDPYGETIYFAHPISESGGQLDVDDIDGYGPENIFWPKGEAPEGHYVVQVDYYSGSGVAGYTVLVQINGQAMTYNGSIAENQTVHVVSFINSASTRALPIIKESKITIHEKRPPKFTRCR